MVVIGPGTAEQARRYARRLRLPFPVAADPARSVYQAFALERVLARTIQRSGVFLVDGAGIIRYAHTATNPWIALSLRQVFQRLREIAAGLPAR